MERDRITEFYFDHVVDKMARLVIDRALHGEVSNSWPRWEEMLGLGAASGFAGAPKSAAAVQGAAPASARVSVQLLAGAPGESAGIKAK